MPELPKTTLETAAEAVACAQATRRYHARKTDPKNEERQAEIEASLGKLRAAMKPLRHEIARYPYGPQTASARAYRDALAAASQALQRERRKLWKLKPR